MFRIRTYATTYASIDVIDVENALNLVKICVSFVFLVVGSFPAKRHLKSHPKGYH